MRAEKVPRLVEVLLSHPPEEVRIAYGGEYVVRLHAVVAVVCAQLEEFGQVFVPHVEIHRHRSLAHSELVYGYGGVVDEPHPPYHSACHAFETSYVAACGTHLSEVHTHSAAELAHHCEVVYAAVYALKSVGHGVDEAA